MGTPVAGQRPGKADAATAVEVRGVRDGQRCRDANRTEQVLGQADVVDERTEVRLERSGLRRIGLGAQRVHNRFAAATSRLVNQLARHVAAHDEPEMVDERRLIGIVDLDRQVHELCGTALQVLHHPLDGGVVQLHVAALHDAVAASCEDLVALRDAHRERLLAEDVDTGAERRQDGVAMDGIRDGDDDGVQVQRERILERRACVRHAIAGRDRVANRRRRVGDGDEVESCAVVPQRWRVGGLAHEARAEQCDADPLERVGRRFERDRRWHAPSPPSARSRAA